MALRSDEFFYIMLFGSKHNSSRANSYVMKTKRCGGTNKKMGNVEWCVEKYLDEFCRTVQINKLGCVCIREEWYINLSWSILYN